VAGRTGGSGRARRGTKPPGDSLEGERRVEVERVARVDDLVLATRVGRAESVVRGVRAASWRGRSRPLSELVDERVGAALGGDDAEALEEAELGQSGERALEIAVVRGVGREHAAICGGEQTPAS
jgi:hypothetical protein